MSGIAHAFYTSSPLLFLPLIALVLFFGVFVGVVVRAMSASRHGIDAAARLPFEAKESDSHE